MSKPLGVTRLLRVRMPSVTEDAIWDAVQSAINAGWSSKQFISEARQAWEECSNDRLQDELREFK